VTVPSGESPTLKRPF